MEFSSYMVVLFLIFWKTSLLFSIWLHQCTLLPTENKNFHFLQDHQYLYFSLFENDYPQVWGDISTWFNLHFPEILVCQASFHILVGHLCACWKKCIFRFLQIAFFIFLFSVCIPYIFWILTHYLSYDLQIFCPSP